MRALAESYRYGSLVHEGFKLAIVGRPNVGKSSLFNALLERDRAIVTEIPGTTRDVVSETASIGGIPVKLFDTAGIRDAAERVESLGIERSYQAMADADVTLVVVDISQPIAPEDRALIDHAKSQGHSLLAGNKCDLSGAGLQTCPEAGREAFLRPLAVSALSGAGAGASGRLPSG